MTQNLHVCTIFCLPEVVYDVISSQNVKIIEGYLVVNFEVDSSNNLVTAAEADITDSIKRKRIHLLLKSVK